MVLTRDSFTAYGVFGTLHDDHGNQYTTLEHAYLHDDGSYAPKLPAGQYICRRGKHSLHDGVVFETFEILGVPGHTGMLFHVGNYNCDSDGCVLIGRGANYNMITHSKDAFAQFMAGLDGITVFNLEVE